MLIFLLRHGKAEANAESDQARALTQDGIHRNESVIQQFKLLSPIVDRMLTSPYLRAQQTAAAVSSLFRNLSGEDCNALVPDTDVEVLLDFIEKSEVQNLLLIGHNPLLSNLLSLLVDGTVDTNRQLGTSTLVCVAIDLIAPGCGDISYTLQP